MLGSIGAGLAGLLIRPLQAQEQLGPPQRLLIVHFPCGTIAESFFPSSLNPDAPLPLVLSPFEALRNDMAVLEHVTNPRDWQWLGDAHGMGMLTMLTGVRPITIPGTDSAGDPNAKNLTAAGPSIDQHLLSLVPGLKGGSGPLSLQCTGHGESDDGLPCTKVMSYRAVNEPMYPIYETERLFESLFGGLSPRDAAALDDDQSVLDCVKADLDRLQPVIPASQKDKLASHVDAIGALQESLRTQQVMANNCKPPEQETLLLPPPEGVSVTEAHHLPTARNQLNIIRTAFQCDLTRVATMTFAHGLSDIRFSRLDPSVTHGDGHHSLSHAPDTQLDIANIDRIYMTELAKMLKAMKATPEGNGTLLDNTLVVVLSECAYGLTHAIENMPVLMFGGKNLGLQHGLIDCKQQYMNDVWSAVAAAYKVPAKFGSADFNKGPVSGLFA